MDNVIVRIVLPLNLALLDGTTLQQDTTLEVIGQVDPWYCSTDQVRLEGGAYLNRLSDTTIAAMIYQCGRQCDAITYFRPKPPPPQIGPFESKAMEVYRRFFLAQQRWTQLRAAYTLILNTWDINSSRGVKTLGNFSITRYSQDKGDDVPKKLTEMKTEIDAWAIVVKSAGRLGVGEHMLPVMAAKGLFDPDAPAGRTWSVTGMGAPMKSIAGFGSMGKPVKFGIPSIVNVRFGRYLGGYMSSIPTYLIGAYQL